MGTPNFNALLCSIWGDDYEGAYWNLAAASNVVVGTNPSYSVTDFLSLFPKWGGVPLTPTGNTTIGSNVITNVSSTANLATGQYLVSLGISPASIPPGTTVVSWTSNTITISQNAVSTATGITLTIFSAPLVPYAIINVFLALASSSLVQQRWLDSWTAAMGLFIDHYLTLWARSNGSTYANAGQAASAGLVGGIVTSKQAGPVSMSIQPLEGLESWGAWQQTESGALLATMAGAISAGPVWLW